MFYGRVFVARYYFDVRWKALTLAHRMVRKTLFSNTFRPTWRHLQLLECPRISTLISRDFSFWGTPATSNAAMSAEKCRKIKFYPPFYALGSGLSSAHRINIVRQTRDHKTSFFWKSVRSSRKSRFSATLAKKVDFSRFLSNFKLSHRALYTSDSHAMGIILSEIIHIFQFITWK